MKLTKHTFLTVGIILGLLLGGILGQVIFEIYDHQVPLIWLDVFSFCGNTLFIGLLKMVLVPLVASSVIVGVASIGDPTRLGKIGGLTLLYYFSTMVIAVLIGVMLVSTLAPGDPHGDGSGIGQNVIAAGQAVYQDDMSQDKRQHIQTQAQTAQNGAGMALWTSFKNIASQIVPKNPIGAAAKGQLLPVISFSLILGIVITILGDKGQPVLQFFQSVFDIIMTLVDWILYLAPLGVFFLVAWTVARLGGAQVIQPLATYMLTVLAGLALHALVVLPLILWLFGKTNPYAFLIQMRQALLTAFGTDSSSATLPVTMETAETLGGVSKKASRFVLPLGATINMDGTALYEAVAVVFLFQCYGITLGPAEIAIIVITATLAAVGAAGIPSAGLVTMAIVVEAVNHSLGGDKTLPLAAVGILLGVDRILDMCRTTVNVWGDAVGAKIITRLTPNKPDA